MLWSCSRNGSMRVSKKRNMGFGPLGIAAEAGFGSDGGDAAEKAEPPAKRGKRDTGKSAVFGAQASWGRLRLLSPRRSGSQREQDASGRTSKSAADGAGECVESNSFRPPRVRAQHDLASQSFARDGRSHTRVDGRNHLEFFAPRPFSSECCRPATVGFLRQALWREAWAAMSISASRAQIRTPRFHSPVLTRSNAYALYR